MRPWRMSNRELTPATSLPHGGHFGLMSSTSVPDGETGGRLALDLLFLGQWPLARCPVPDALKLRSFMVHWSPALSCGEHIRVPLESCVSELFCPGGAMALSGIGFGDQEGQWCPVTMMDGEPGRRVVLGPHRPQASVLQPGAHPSSALKLRSYPARWSPALSCVSFSSQASPLELTGIALSQMVKPEENLHWDSCSWAGVHQSVAQPHDVLKLRSFLVPWSPALNCVSFSSRAGPLELTGIALSQMVKPEENLHWDSCSWAGVHQSVAQPHDVLKLRSFLVPWFPALNCVSFSSQAGPLELTGIVSSSAQVGPMALSGIDGKPGGRVVLGPHRPQASVLQPGARPPGVLKLRPSLAPWSPAELCELFLPGGPPGIDWHSELLHPAGPLALTGIVLREMHHPINESRVTAFITHTFKIDRWASDDSLLRLLCLLI
ncbi:uncharacterized protein isoform X1 [Macaca fascicularis]|uniref:uncharacterized protein isoform X1 n=1 Tax=Macaca fascicularis TaxID=9541 RepID=UPI0032B06902